jgi:hypothetical protein
VQDEQVPLDPAPERFFSGSRGDPAKPVAIELDEGWQEPPIKFGPSEKEKESNFTSEVNIDFWFEEPTKDEKAEN